MVPLVGYSDPLRDYDKTGGQHMALWGGRFEKDMDQIVKEFNAMKSMSMNEIAKARYQKFRNIDKMVRK